MSVKAFPTPPLAASDGLWASECRSLPSARPTTVFAGGIRLPSIPEPALVPGELTPFGLLWLLLVLLVGLGEVADVMMAARAILECCTIPDS